MINKKIFWMFMAPIVLILFIPISLGGYVFKWLCGDCKNNDQCIMDKYGFDEEN